MHQGLSGGSVVENPPANARHTRLIPGLGKMPQAEGLKEETDRAGLHLGLCPVSMETMHKLENQTPWVKEPQDLYLDSPLPEEYANYLCNRTKS